MKGEGWRGDCGRLYTLSVGHMVGSSRGEKAVFGCLWLIAGPCSYGCHGWRSGAGELCFVCICGHASHTDVLTVLR